MRVLFSCNLDDVGPWIILLNDSWKYAERGVPQIGSGITFWDEGGTKSFELQVVAVRYGATKARSGEPYVHVELHMPKHFTSIRVWQEYFSRHWLGRNV